MTGDRPVIRELIERTIDRCISRHGSFRHGNRVGFCDECWGEVLAAVSTGAQGQQDCQTCKDLRLELSYLMHREYDDNAATCFSNRRHLAKVIAKQLDLTDAEREEMRLAGAEHGSTGAEIIRWLVAKLRAEVQQLVSPAPGPARAETPDHPPNYQTEPCECKHDWGSHHGHVISPHCRWCPCMEYAPPDPPQGDPR